MSDVVIYARASPFGPLTFKRRPPIIFTAFTLDEKYDHEKRGSSEPSDKK